MATRIVDRSGDSASIGTETLHYLFPRESGCVECLDATPVCPVCPSGQSCQITVPLTCTECPKSYCAQNAATPTSTSTSKATSHTNTGAIAGGVIGGVAAIAILTYCVWRFCIKTRRQPLPTKEDGNSGLPTDAEMSFSTRRNQRASTHTAHSVASTVLTRASNIIQIAYIPGVMNRATPTSPTVLVPPVPPIPITVSNSSNPSTPSGPDDQHFFVPGDLRDSTYSGYSGFSDRTSYARTSYAPRSSIASTIYGKNAVIAAPTQTGMRAKPTMVNLKSPSGLNPGNSLTPPVPNVDYEKYNNPRPSSEANSTFSVGSTFLNSASAHTATPVRPVVVRVGSIRKKSPLNTNATVANSDTSTEKDSIDNEKIDNEKSFLISSTDEKEPTSPATNTRRDSNGFSIIDDSPTVDQGPFSDPPTRVGERNTNSLNAVMEEPTRREPQRDASGTSTDRGRSPFGDENATHDD